MSGGFTDGQTLTAAELNTFATTTDVSVAVSAAVAGLVTPASLTTTLTNYVTNSALSTSLSGYATTSYVTSALGAYVTTSSLTSTLGGYVTSSSLTSTLTGYATTTSVTASLASYTTTANLAAAGGSGLLGYSATGSYSAGTLGHSIQLRGTVVTDAPYNADPTGATDSTTAIQNAINAAAGTSIPVILPPGGIFQYSALTMPSSSITPIQIIGYGAVLQKSTASGNGLTIQGSAGGGGPSGVRREGATVLGVRLTHGVTQTAGTTVNILNAEHVTLRDVRIENPYSGITIQDCFDVNITDGYIRNSSSYDIKTLGTSTSPTCIDTYITSVVGEGVSGNTTKVGLWMDSGTSGLYAEGCDFTQGAIGVQVTNNGSIRAEYGFFTNVLADTNASIGWNFSADCKGMRLTQSWASTSGGNGFQISNGVGFEFDGCIAINNAQHGLSIAGTGGEYEIHGGIYSQNSTSSSNTYNGINIAAGISGFSIQGVRAGNVSGIGSGGSQGYGISIASGASTNYAITDCDVRGNGTGGISDGGSGTAKRLHDNLGFNPRGYLGAVTMPASFTAVTNPFGTDCMVCLTGGTVTVVEIGTVAGFVTTGLTSGPFRVPAGGQIRVTYSSAPSWVWFAD